MQNSDLVMISYTKYIQHYKDVHILYHVKLWITVFWPPKIVLRSGLCSYMMEAKWNLEIFLRLTDGRKDHAVTVVFFLIDL